MDGVKIATPHARSTALLAFGTKAVGVEIVGVDPVVEQKLNRLIRAIGEGRYLEPEDAGVTVIGSTVAERLDVELGDELLLSIVGKGGQMEYAMVRIVGIVRTGSREIDGSICHVALADIEMFTGYQGLGDITVLFDDPRRIGRTAAELQGALPEGDLVLTWKEIIPAQGGDMDSDRVFMTLIAGIVVVVVVLGVTSAQLTAILERKRELAVLMALGMRHFHVMRLVLIEAAVVGVLGAAAGLLLATPLVYHTSTKGFNFAALMGGDSAMSGVLFDPVFYSDMGAWMIPHALTVALVSTFIAALYPALFAVRTNPASALTLREG
jgi:ABC-type lipoprotein release transport system permease subunit